MFMYYSKEMIFKYFKIIYFQNNENKIDYIYEALNTYLITLY